MTVASKWVQFLSVKFVNCESKASIIWGKKPDTDRSSQSPKWSIKKCAAPTKLIIKKEYCPIPRSNFTTVTPVVKDLSQVRLKLECSQIDVLFKQLPKKDAHREKKAKPVNNVEITRPKRSTEERNEILCFVKAVKAEPESPKKPLIYHKALSKASKKRSFHFKKIFLNLFD